MSLRADAILFDKDGTLFDFEATWGAWAHDTLERLSRGDAALADRLAGALGYDRTARRFAESSIVIAGTPREVADAIAPILGMPAAGLIDDLNDSAAAAPMAEAVPLGPLLSGLRAAGLALGVATNDGEAPARAHLAAAGVTGAFAFIAGFDSGWTPKPDPAMCLAFARALDLAPERIVMVGDSLHDLHAGRAAGMQTVAVLTGPAGAAGLAPHADAVLPDIGHLPDWLRA